MDASNESKRDPGTPPVVPVILAGGSGTRLWPLSREQYPKQFLSLVGERSLLQDTLLRASRIEHAVAPVIIGSHAHRFLVSEQLQQAGIAGATLLLEPCGRNTAPAATVAAQFVAAQYGPEAILFLMSADNAILDEDAFMAAARAGARLASQRRMVVFGIKPTRAETGFGYIRLGRPIEPVDCCAVEVAAFVEKPDAARARQFLEEGGYAWNAGMFMFRADRFLADVERLEPALAASAAESLVKATHANGFVHLDAAAFGACRKESIDYAVMEKASDLAVVPLDAGWDDVGCWTFMDNLPATDERRNRTRGDVLLHEADGNLVHSSSRLVTLLGVTDHVVIETADAVLVTTRDRAQDVKHMVAQLKSRSRSEAETHARVNRPWGTYESVAQGPRFQVKRIVVKPGEKLSLQMHHHRAEHWIVVRGTARVTCGQRVFLLSENQSTYIPLGYNHRLENPGKVPLELIEVQAGGYLGEDDIVRFEDVYGRTPESPPPGIEAPAALEAEAAAVDERAAQERRAEIA